MNRLQLPVAELGGATVTVRGDALSYLRDVLRLRPGAELEIFDGAGGLYPSTIGRYEPDGVVIELGARAERPFAGVRVTLVQGLPKGDKFELVVQKAVELGVTTIVPVAMDRCIVRLDPKKAVERVARWQKIADEAARQSARADVATIEPLTTLRELVARPTGANDVRLLLDEEERTRRLRDALGPAGAAYTVLIGPEGGVSREESALVRGAGFVGVTLGPRILRTETAPLAVLAILQHLRGDLG